MKYVILLTGRKSFSQTFLMIYLLSISFSANSQNNTPVQKVPSAKFSEGIIYSKTTFPGHALNETFKKLDLENPEFLDQSNLIDALKKYQQSINGMQEQDIKDGFFISGMMLLPVYSKMYYTSAKSVIETYALGYRQQTLIDNTGKTGKLVLLARDKSNQGTIAFKTNEIKEVWQKYQVNAEQYSIQKTAETAVIAGYPCKKIVYTFGGTTRGLPVSNYVINMEPHKVTVWYSDDLPATINLIHPHYFDLDKAVLKYEVEFDKNHKNKMLVEITKLEQQKIEEEKFDVKELVPVIEHKQGSYEGGTIIMQVMMNAISLLTK